MNPLFLPWCLLTIVGNLPEELIIKILYHYSGLRHPIVNMLLNSTKVYEYELLQKLPFSNFIYKFYINHTKYNNRFNIEIINYINKHKIYFKGDPRRSLLRYNNPGYFIPRQFGRLYYNTLNENDLIETIIHVDWKLKNVIMRKGRCQYIRLYILKSTHEFALLM